MQLGGCVLPLPSHWDLHLSPLSLHGLWLPVDVDCGVTLGAISQLVEGVCLGDRQPFLYLPQPREFNHSGMDVSRCQWENWTYREFSGSSVSNLFWGKSEEFRNLYGNDVGSPFPQVFSSGQLSQSHLHDHSQISRWQDTPAGRAIRLAGVGPVLLAMRASGRRH